VNVLIAGEEADLSWVTKVLIEIDGGPFHLDVGEDARKQARWEKAGWTVRRISSDDVYHRPERLLALAAALNVPRDVR
jgi:very-short-patch-repair endonuclease